MQRLVSNPCESHSEQLENTRQAAKRSSDPRLGFQPYKVLHDAASSDNQTVDAALSIGSLERSREGEWILERSTLRLSSNYYERRMGVWERPEN